MMKRRGAIAISMALAMGQACSADGALAQMTIQRVSVSSSGVQGTGWIPLSVTLAGSGQVTLTATPSGGAQFRGWSRDADCADGSVIMAGDLSCTATFTSFPWIMFNNILTGSGKK